jgi:ATPase subunit of ABC transporter with duplicated ATPase domains
MLTLNSATIEIGARVLLDRVSLRIHPGEKVALVGANGAGKTTLLRAITGDRPFTSGSATLPADAAHLRQESVPSAAEDKELAFDHLLSGSALSAMGRELQELAVLMGASQGSDLERVMKRFGSLQDEFVARGGYELEAQAERVAAGVGLTEEALLSPVGVLSGGQRRRLELARLLLSGASLFILDEPTNHLDADAKRWVMDFMGTATSTVLMVSHDIALMDKAIDRVLVLEAGQIDSYDGTYSDFLRQRAQRENQRLHVARNLARESARLSETKKMFAKANATHAAKRQALQRRIDALEARLADSAPRIRRRQVAFRFPDPPRSGELVLELSGATRAFDGRPIFSGIDLTIGRTDVVLLVGANGAGKTTLLKCMAGRDSLDCGTRRLGANVNIGYYAQEHEEIDPAASVLANLVEASPTTPESTLRAVLGHFGMVGDTASQPAGTLSGGEKTKLALARLIASRANLLLLDEPTNNLDPDSVEALLAALQHYEGTVVLVSHDADFVCSLAPERVLLLPSGQMAYFDAQVLDLIPRR